MKKRELSVNLSFKKTPGEDQQDAMRFYLMIKDYPLHKWVFFKALKKINHFGIKFLRISRENYWWFETFDLPSIHFFMYDGKVISEQIISREEAVKISPNWGKYIWDKYL